MTRPDPDRIQLHPTGLSLFSDCGEAWRRTYEEGEHQGRNEYLIVGTAVDDSVMADLGEKIQSGHLLSERDAVDIAYESVRRGFNRGGLAIPVRFRAEALKSCIARAGAFALYAHRKLSPTINVASVQEKWSIRIDKMLRDRGGLRGRWAKIDLVGTLDIKEWSYPDDFSSTEEPDGVIIRDIKTARASPPKDSSEGKHWTQLTSYALGEFVKTGKVPKRVQIDTLVSLKGGVAHRPSFGERTDYDFAALFNRIVRFAQARKAGMYLPAPRGSWKCSRQWCHHYSSCCYVKNLVTIDLAVPPLRVYKDTCNSPTPPALRVLEQRRIIRRDECPKEKLSLSTLPSQPSTTLPQA